MFKQFLQASALQFVQIDSCRLGSVNENLAVLLMAYKFQGKSSRNNNHESYRSPRHVFSKVAKGPQRLLDKYCLHRGNSWVCVSSFSVPVCPHAGGVGLCELVQHLILFDYICVSADLRNR